MIQIFSTSSGTALPDTTKQGIHRNKYTSIFLHIKHSNSVNTYAMEELSPYK